MASGAEWLARDLADFIMAGKGVVASSDGGGFGDRLEAILGPLCEGRRADLGRAVAVVAERFGDLAAGSWHLSESPVSWPPPGRIRKLQQADLIRGELS